MPHDPQYPMAYVTGFSSDLGENIVTNEDLQIENPTWVMSRTAERTGISARTIAPEGTTALDMAERAAKKCLATTKTTPELIDGLIFCTQTPDHILPSNSSLLHGRLGLSHRVLSLDITHACSGFVYALGIAKSFVMSRAASNVLVVTGDTYSRLIHPKDRSVRAIFGDGAACCLVTSTPDKATVTNPVFETLDVEFWTAGEKADRFKIDNGGARSPFNLSIDPQPDKNARVKSANHIQMDGLGLLSFFNSKLPCDIVEVLDRNSLDLSSIDHFVFHQASKMAIDGIVRALKLPEAKVVRTFGKTGNLVSSSIPSALVAHIAADQIKSRDFVVVCGFGVGLSWSIALLRSI